MRPEGERDLKVVVWENIEKYRKERDLSQIELCKLVGYNSVQYSKNKKRPKSVTFPVLQRFAYILRVKTIDLIDDWSEE
ncbi:helix-turn-helix domain-containing protein [Vagococcus sp. DIV0080]|uniref:Helix-turn-helix domain-containing protein n=1 Tax=Candidatus Vagococcus giribetii TaxID=2230876 RepID=A0ABS3HW61_9ENTE|nr:helix-turn-helix transcriptional regulator [Vagococcus sp. DIV0080]MBO0477945.1 helix-turn-helix domain-containing protein [Vagococcus sp. DIV0080]